MFKGFDVQEKYKKMAEEKYKKMAEWLIEKFLKYTERTPLFWPKFRFFLM